MGQVINLKEFRDRKKEVIESRHLSWDEKALYMIQIAELIQSNTDFVPDYHGA